MGRIDRRRNRGVMRIDPRHAFELRRIHSLLFSSRQSCQSCNPVLLLLSSLSFLLLVAVVVVVPAVASGATHSDVDAGVGRVATLALAAWSASRCASVRRPRSSPICRAASINVVSG